MWFDNVPTGDKQFFSLCSVKSVQKNMCNYKRKNPHQNPCTPFLSHPLKSLSKKKPKKKKTYFLFDRLLDISIIK